MTKTKAEQFNVVVRFIRFCCMICGADVLDPNYKKNLLLYFVIFSIYCFFAFSIYTIYVSFVVHGDWTDMLMTLCMFGSGLQGYVKLESAVSNRTQLRFLLSELVSIYKEYEAKHERYQNSLKRSTFILVNFIKSVALMYFIIVTGIIITALLCQLVFNRVEYVLQFQVPFVDPTTDMGLFILNCIQILFLLFGSFGNFASDMYFFLCCTHLSLFNNILKCKFGDLNDEIRRCELAAETTRNKELLLSRQEPRKCLEMLKDIFQWHQRYIVFVAVIKDIYYWVILVQVATLAMGMACTIFCLLLGKWLSGYGYIIYCLVILYIFCGLGTLADISIEDFTHSIYNDVIWYRLTVSEQKMLRIMLVMSQNMEGLTVGSVAPLSMNTGLAVTKTIYSFAMMLINFIE